MTSASSVRAGVAGQSSLYVAVIPHRSVIMSKPVILITGALTGIGRATARAFARSGARLVVSGRRQAEGKALEAELRQLGAEVAFIQADVRHNDEVCDLVDQAVARFGRLGAAVNNAGTEGQPGPACSTASPAQRSARPRWRPLF